MCTSVNITPPPPFATQPEACTPALEEAASRASTSSPPPTTYKNALHERYLWHTQQALKTQI